MFLFCLIDHGGATLRSLPFLQDVNSMLGHQSLLTITSSTHKKLQK